MGGGDGLDRVRDSGRLLKWSVELVAKACLASSEDVVVDEHLCR